MIKLITGLLLVFGSFLTLTASIGMLRFPDLYTRMHAATKAGTLGVGFMLAAASLFFHSFTVIAESIILIGFIFTAAPVAAHLLARSAYKTDEKLYNPTQTDELKSYQNIDDHTHK